MIPDRLIRWCGNRVIIPSWKRAAPPQYSYVATMRVLFQGGCGYGERRPRVTDITVRLFSKLKMTVGVNTQYIKREVRLTTAWDTQCASVPTNPNECLSRRGVDRINHHSVKTHYEPSDIVRCHPTRLAIHNDTGIRSNSPEGCQGTSSMKMILCDEPYVALKIREPRPIVLSSFTNEANDFTRLFGVLASVNVDKVPCTLHDNL